MNDFATLLRRPQIRPESGDGAERSALGRRPESAPCGWYDSSFELRDGLDIVEQSDDALFQLWQLAV